MRRINFKPTPAYLAGFIALTVLLSVGAGVLAWEPWNAPDQPPHPSHRVSPQSQPTTPSPDPIEEVEEIAEPIEFTIGAVGDVLLHDTPIRVAHQGGSDYDFTPLLESTRAWSEGVDLAICNMEVPLALPGEAPSGYPLFGAPEQIVQNLADLGWNGCSTGT
ncbi:MAG TPA: CapA family protein, partial [Beutenbergiaceae bacterium]|nr:CapA family protein [Beutenbergiaceae bacterium]